MKHKQPKMEYTYPSTKLTVYVKLLLTAHFSLFYTLLLDFITLAGYEGKNRYIRKLTSGLICVLNYHPNPDTTIALLSSLLVVWTFITAVAIFYMEKKDNTYCGIRTWDIISFDINRNIKRISAAMFFIELLLMLLAFIFDLSCTLIYFLFLYPVTAGCTFAFICWATKTETIKSRYYDKILYEYYEHNNDSVTPMERIPSLNVYLNSLSSFTEKDWDLLIDLLLNIFISLCLESRKDKQSDVQRVLYTIVSYILNNTGDTNQKIKFLKNLSVETYKKAKDSPSAIDILTAVAFPAAAFQDNTGYCYYTNCFTVIPDDTLSRQLLLRGIVYSVYLNHTTRSYLYSVYSRKLQTYLGPADPESDEDWSQMRFFAYKLGKYDSQFTPDILDQYIHR